MKLKLLYSERTLRASSIRRLVVLLILGLMCNLALGQQISGRVVDAQNQPVVGATIVVKGSTKGALTAVDGKFSIAADPKSTLEISSLGYISQSLVVGDKKSLNVVLIEDSQSIAEIVVTTGYDTYAKKDFTGSVGVVNMNDIAKAPVISIDQALAGRIAGVSIIPGDGQPGSEASILVRGTGSFSSDAGPLYVIDGFPQESSGFSSINSNDIESITVLKDASSTAIYGARGANGVVVVTTKRGKLGKPQISYSGLFGLNNITNQVESMGPYDFVKMQADLANELILRGGSSNNSTKFVQATYFKDRDLESYRNEKGIDWQDKMFRTAATSSHTISVSGKTKETGYYLSMNYAAQEGIAVNTNFDRYTGKLTLDQKITNNIKASGTVKYTSSLKSGPMASNTNVDYAEQALMNSLWQYRPVSWDEATMHTLEHSIRDRGYDGNSDPYPASTNVRELINPYLSAINEVNNANYTNFTANADLEISFLKNFKFIISGGYSNTDTRDEKFYNKMTREGTEETEKGKIAGPNGSINSRQIISMINTNKLIYAKTFNKIHAINAMAVFELNKKSVSAYGFSANNVPDAELGIRALESGTVTGTSSSGSKNAMMSYMGRLNYTLMNRYILTGSLRADGSSKFAPNHKWGYFPSGAFAWRFTEENFMKPVSKYISSGKLRTSYGTTGNNRVSDYAHAALIDTSTGDNYPFGGTMYPIGSSQSSLENIALTWETTKTFDVGIELGLFKDRVVIEADYYSRKTEDLLLRSSLSVASGFSTMQRNIGTIRNRGFELSISSINISKRDWRWTSNFNISFNRNQVLSFAEGEISKLSSVKYFDDAYIARVGYPVAQFYGYVYDGLYQMSDFDIMPSGQMVANAYGVPVSIDKYILKSNIPYIASTRGGSYPGDVRFKDLNGDGVINEKDRVIVGNPYPKHTGGLSNSLTYKNFNLNIFFQWSYGNQILNGTVMSMTNKNDIRLFAVNRFDYMKDYWTMDNTDAKYPSLAANATGQRAISDYRLEDGSYLRLKTASLSYNVPRKLLTKIGISNLSITVSGQNLFTWTKYKGQDPEISSFYSPLTPGYDNGAYPMQRTISFGLNITL